MQGKVLDYNNEFKSGLIRGNDDNKYRFSIDDCKSTISPKSGADVDFEPNGDKAVEIYILTKDAIDTIKETATDATVLAVKVSSSGIKKIMPYAIITAIVIILVSLIFVANTEYENYQHEEAIKQKQAKLNHDSEKAKLLFQNKQYNEALILYTDLIDRSYDITIDRSQVVTFTLMATECLIKLNNPIRAEAALEKMDIYDNNIAEEDKARYYVLKAKINKLNNDYKSTSTDFFDSDYYSANAKSACSFGDCSLVEK
jgi:hypothetical protein